MSQIPADTILPAIAQSEFTPQERAHAQPIHSRCRYTSCYPRGLLPRL